MKYMLFVVVLLTAFMGSCSRSADPANKPKGKNAPFVRIESVEKTRLVSYIDITGTIEANISTDITSPAEGVLETLMARENQRVEKDQVIAVINPNDRLALIANNQLQIQQLEQKLSATTQGSDEHKLLTQELEQARDNLVYAKDMYKTIPVICPMSGVVTHRWTDQGGQLGQNEKILTISDMNSLVIKAEVNEKYFEAVKTGNQFPVILNAYPNDTLTGRISLVYPQVDPQTRSVKFDIRIQNFSKSLLPGMMAYIKIPVSVKEDAYAVPEQAVLTSPDDQRFLFWIDSDSIAHRRVVETGITSGSKLEITRGINENEKIVVSGQEMLRDSLKVKIK